MGGRRDTLTMIRTSFAGRDGVIERAFRDNESFRGLCRDYAKCAAALDHWQRVQAPVAAHRRQEYGELLEELGREIEDRLNTMHARQPPASKRPT